MRLSFVGGSEKVKVYENSTRTGEIILPRSWSVSSLPKTIYLEGVEVSGSLADIKLELRYTGAPAPSCKDLLNLTVIKVDLDIDSDNSQTVPDNAPQRTTTEDAIEDDPDEPGRIVWVNHGDDDRDNVTDFGDGYDLDGAAGNDDDANPNENGFVRMVLEVLAPIDLSVATVGVSYSASDPSAATITTTPPGIAPAPGDLRIWTKDGNQVRNSSVIPSGDYVAPGTYAPSDLGLSNGARTVNLWLEGISPSSGSGTERIVVEADPDGAGPAPAADDAVRVTVSQLEIVDESMALTDHVSVGHWGDDRGTNELSGYTTGLSGMVVNGAGGTFIDADPDRFSVRLTHHPGNTDPAVAEPFTIQIATLTETGGVHDADHNITLIETGPNTGIFTSETQLVTAPDLTLVAATDQDDGFAVYSAPASGTVADEADNDRTHKVATDGHVRATYNDLGGSSDLTAPLCDRTPTDQRREVRIRVHVFNEPYDDVGLDGMPGTGDVGEGNGVYDVGEPYVEISGDSARNTVLGSATPAANRVSEELTRSNAAWVQACIQVVQVGSTVSEDAPTDASGVNILRDGLFSPGPGADEEVVLTSASGAAYDIVEVYFVGPFVPAAMAEGLASTPALRGGITLPAGQEENTYLFVASSGDVRRRVLAHELGHALTNEGDVITPVYVFFPSRDGSTVDDRVNQQRRTTHQTETNARTCRAKKRCQAEEKPKKRCQDCLLTPADAWVV